MAKDNKVEYERVDEESDDYRRILVKFNPSIWTGSDFEIEFIPLENAIRKGRIFVREVDSISSYDLYQWSTRRRCLMGGTSKTEGGTIITKDDAEVTAEYLTERWRKGKIKLEPREVIGKVKRLYDIVVEEFNEATAFALNHFLYAGELGSLPFGSPYFTVEKLKRMIEDAPFKSRNSDGDMVERPLVRHLLDVHKTEHVTRAISKFLYSMFCLRAALMEEEKKKHREEKEKQQQK